MDSFSKEYTYIASVVSAGLGLYLLHKFLVVGKKCRSKARLDGKFVIITGANTGIGKETAKDLVLRGARVMLACRDPLKALTAAEDISKSTGCRLCCKTLDLSDLKSVRKFAAEINEAEPRLDILINNAGVMCCPKSSTKQGHEMQFGTNHLGHFLLTCLLKDLLIRSGSSRVVNVSADAYKIGKIDFDDMNSDLNYSAVRVYATSKLANILFTRELSKILKDTKVTVNALHPGIISTELGRHIEDRFPLLLPLAWLLKFMLFKTPTQGAQTTIYCAVSEDLVGVTGKYFKDCKEVKLTPIATDDETAKHLWTLSETKTSIIG